MNAVAAAPAADAADCRPPPRPAEAGGVGHHGRRYRERRSGGLVGAGRGSGSATAAAALPPPASPGAPVDLRSPNWQEAFANRVQWLVDTQVGEARIKLNPPELGAVDVKISLVDDKTYVQLTTATARPRATSLSQSSAATARAFTRSGLELGGASVHDGRDGHASARRSWRECGGAAPVRRVRRAGRRACGRAARAVRSVASTSSLDSRKRRFTVAAPPMRQFSGASCSHRNFANSSVLTSKCPRLAAWHRSWNGPFESHPARSSAMPEEEKAPPSPPTRRRARAR